jgi:hypothetical protein
LLWGAALPWHLGFGLSIIANSYFESKGLLKMADENHMLNLRFATFQPLYCQQQKSTLPKELQLSEKVLSLVNNPLPSYSFTKEYEVS